MHTSHRYISHWAVAIAALFSIEANAQDNSIRNGGEYYLYNTYYDRVLGANAAYNGMALSKYGTQTAENYVFVADASTLHDGWYWLHLKGTTKYLQASNKTGDTWSVWMAGSLNAAYNSYEWLPTAGSAGSIRSNRGEVVNSVTKCYLGVDEGKEANDYINVYYDKELNAKSTWQILDANYPIEVSRLKLYTDELDDAIKQGEDVYKNPVYGQSDELSVALYNARSAREDASLDSISTMTTARTALLAAIENAQEGKYTTWISGSSFGTNSAFTIALKSFSLEESMAEGEVQMLVRNTKGTGMMVYIGNTYARIGETKLTVESPMAANDWQFAFDGTNVTVYANGNALGTVAQNAIPAATSVGTSAEWTVFGVNAIKSCVPEIVSFNFAFAPNEYYQENGKSKNTALKLSNASVTLSEPIDYHILAASNVMTDASIDLADKDAWVIFDNVRPSDVIGSYLKGIKINGAAAVNGTNCRVAIYLQGAVVYPYSPQDVALYGYDGEMFSGTEYTFRAGVNNKMGNAENELRSFILKRGYMVCFSTESNGSGYSRVYVADHQDKKVELLPELLNGRISRAYIRPWNWVSKKGWCSTEGTGAINTEGKNLGTTWFYTWSADRSTQTDMEYVPMQGHLYWPSTSALNQSNATAMLSFNEPDHSEQHSDDCGSTIDSWTATTKMPSYQESGLRIGSPSPTDASWLKSFTGHCDDMAYRVDFVAFHAYWGTNEASNSDAWWSRLNQIYKDTGRPIWLTEWNNGASWTTESWPSSYSDKLAKQKSAIKSILSVLDNADFVERYALYNWDTYYRAAISWDSDKNSWWVTPCGEVYRDAHPSHAYKESMQKVPVGWWPKTQTANQMSVIFTSGGRTFTPTITNLNGDFTKTEIIEYQDETGEWRLFYDNSKGRSKLESTAARTESKIKLDSVADYHALINEEVSLRLHITTLAGSEAYSEPVSVGVSSYLRNHYRQELAPVGDVDLDLKVSISDVTTMIGLYLGEIRVSDVKGKYDIDGDGSLTIGDVTSLIDIYLDGGGE